MSKDIFSQLGDKNICKATITIKVIEEESVHHWEVSNEKGFLKWKATFYFLTWVVVTKVFTFTKIHCHTFVLCSFL